MTTLRPAESRAWARRQASQLRALPGRYGGVAPVTLWGAPPQPLHEAPAAPDAAEAAMAPPDPSERSGLLDLNVPLRAVRGRAGQSRRTDENPALGVSPLDAERIDVQRADPASQSGRVESTAGRPDGVGGETASYPEWDHATAHYLEGGATVRAAPVVAGDAQWAIEILAQHAALVRRLRLQFERLRAHRLRLDRQSEGEELDLAACVNAIVDRHTGRSPDDRRYARVRAARRPLAIALLADASGSTDIRVTDALQIIDVEKIALLLASEAFDVLGDSYTMLAFAGKGAGDVRVTTLKNFTERNGDVVRSRIAALAPGGFTRLGAAVRHATALLAAQRAPHRLLLILSDGRPNDLDQYAGPYGVEDSRQAIMEARSRGVYPYCLTVDREGAAYLPRIFGAAGHTILRHPEQLPFALLGMVRQLLMRS